MEQTGVVLSVEKNNILVRVDRTSACGGECRQDCTTCSLEKKQVTIKAKNPVNAQTGDFVLLESDGKKMLFYAFLVYIVPVIAAVCGYYVARYFGATEDLSVLAAMGALLLAFAPALYVNHLVSKKGEAATAVKIIEKDRK